MGYMEMWRDKQLSSRSDMAELLLDLIRPLKKYFSPAHGRLKVGYTKASYGEKAAQMEGFARPLWGLGALWAQKNEELGEELRKEIEEWRLIYQEGLINGTNPESEEYWGEVLDFDQKMVEMAAVASAVCLSPERLWEPLTPEQQKNFYLWFNQINEHQVNTNNWRYFRILVNCMWIKLGLPWSEKRLQEDRALIESCYTDKGWYFDGKKTQVDYYIPFAMQFYGLLYSRFMEKQEPEYCALLKKRAAEFSKEFIYWFDEDGSEIPFGRSLTYRFAHSAFFSAMAFAENEGVGYGIMRTLLLKNLSRWMKLPIFDNTGVLTIGYEYPNLIMSEQYNAPGSPYWALKAFYALAIPSNHPFWTSSEESFDYEAKKKLTEPHMLIIHSEGSHVQAFVTGQSGKKFACGDAKYEKFVYSNKFGFSVSRGASLAEGAFDNTLAVSLAGDDYFRVRRILYDYQVTDDELWMKYQILPGVMAETRIIPEGSWHKRIHKIDTNVVIDIADGGFAIAVEPEEAVPGTVSGRYESEGVCVRENGLFIELPWGTSGVVSMTGGNPEIVRVLPNTNLLHPLTVIPTVTQRLEPGLHTVVTSVFGRPI